MKKTKPKLALSRETIKQLSADLRAVAGGIPGSVNSHCGDQQCSFSCEGTCWTCPKK